MNFEHTEDRRMLADTLNRYIAERYRFEARQKAADSPYGFDRTAWQQFAEMGIIGALFNEADGGYGGAGFDIAVVFEALGRGLVVEPFLHALMAGTAIAGAGDPAQRAQLNSIIDGSVMVGFAHEEPGSRYLLSSVDTRAQRTGSGWVLNGSKAVVQHGDSASMFIVSARSAGTTRDENGISLFLVGADVPGVSVRGTPNIDGGRSAEIVLTDVQLDGGALLGAEGAGLGLLEQAVGRGILALCAEALGAMDVAKAATLEYLQTRKQFGKPIGSFQALQHRMADMLLEIEQARSAVINAAAALDADRVTRERALSAAKFSIGRIGALVAEGAIQLHGAIGMTWELPLAHYAKRLVMIDHQLGDEDHHLARYIALGRPDRLRMPL